MWRKEDGNPQTSPEAFPKPYESHTREGPSSSSPSQAAPYLTKAAGCVSQGIKIKGEVTGTEDLFIDGLVEGKITLSNSAVTVGPNAMVKADITAREIVVRGRAEGKFTATERIQIWHTARVQGDMKSERISIEDGAELQWQSGSGKSPGKWRTANPRVTWKESSSRTSQRRTRRRRTRRHVWCGDGRGGLDDGLFEQAWELPSAGSATWESARCSSHRKKRKATEHTGRRSSGRHRGALKCRKPPRVSNGLKEFLWNLDGLGRRDLAGSGSGMADHAELFYRARIPGDLRRYFARLGGIPGQEKRVARRR